MNAIDLVVNFFKQGGVFLYPIAAVFAIGLGDRRRTLHLPDPGRTRQSPAVGGTGAADRRPATSARPWKWPRAPTRRSSTIMRYGMSRIATARRRDDIEKAMEESLIEVIPRLEKRTHYLATLANIGMLMGLLGTVIGLINAFAAVASVNPAEKASMLSASISVAMNNTALGLGLAITLLLCHMYLETKTTELVDSLEVASIKFLNTRDGAPPGGAAAGCDRPGRRRPCP